MQHRILIIVCFFFGLTATFALGEESDWQTTLRSELQRCSTQVNLHPLIIHVGMHGWDYFTVTAPAAKILEGRRKKELLPYLSELRKSADPIGKDMLNNWTTVVRKGLHGFPTTAKADQEEVAVYNYAVPDYRP